MNWVDAVVIAIIVVSALLAFLRGFVRELLGIGAWVGAAAVAVWGYRSWQPRFLGWIGNPDLADPAASPPCSLGALILFSVLAGMLGGVVRMSLLGGLDRTLGIVFGLARGAVLVAAAYIGLGLVVEPARWPPPLQQARTAPLVVRWCGVAGGPPAARLPPRGAPAARAARDQGRGSAAAAAPGRALAHPKTRQE